MNRYRFGRTVGGAELCQPDSSGHERPLLFKLNLSANGCTDVHCTTSPSASCASPTPATSLKLYDTTHGTHSGPQNYS